MRSDGGDRAPAVEPAIEKAGTLPVEVMHDPAWHRRIRERVFARSWQVVGDEDALAPGAPLDAVMAPLRGRLAALPLQRAVLEPSSLRHYEVNASWILYCDNYLEGFHIPYAHPALAQQLSYADYRTELFPGAVLQI